METPRPPGGSAWPLIAGLAILVGPWALILLAVAARDLDYIIGTARALQDLTVAAARAAVLLGIGLGLVALAAAAMGVRYLWHRSAGDVVRAEVAGQIDVRLEAARRSQYPGLTTYTYSPREPQVAARVLTQAQALLAQTAEEAAQLRQEAEDLRRELARTPALLAQRDADAAQIAEDLAQARAEVVQLRHALAQRPAVVAQPRLSDDAETVEIGATRLSLRQAEAVLGISASTLRRKLAQHKE